MPPCPRVERMTIGSTAVAAPVPTGQPLLIYKLHDASISEVDARSTSPISPTAPWTAQQIVEAFPEDSAPRYLLRDRDNIYGCEFRRRVKSMGIAEVLTAPRSPWQNPFAERVIGTFRRELLDHVIVMCSAVGSGTGAVMFRRLLAVSAVSSFVPV